MSYPLFVSPPSSEYFPGAIKYVEYTGQPRVESTYIASGNPFIVNADGTKILDKLMIVKFDGQSAGEIKDILLKKGIQCGGSCYHFLAYSGEQLENKTCYVSCVTMQKIEEELHLETKKLSVSDQANGLGMLFTNCMFALNLEEREFDFPCVGTRSNYKNTGICGFMSPQLSVDIQKHRGLAHAPSMVRVVHQNFNGLLIRSDHVEAPTKVAVGDFIVWRTPLDELQLSAENPLRNVLGIRDMYKPMDGIGYLDAQTMMLLLEKGVSHSHLEKLQQTYYEILDRLEDEPTRALFFLKITGNEELREKIQENGLTEESRNQLRNVKENEIRNMTGSPCSLRVLVPHARVVLGIPDLYSQLETDQCCFNPTLADGSSEKAVFDSVTEVLVTPCPCYSPTDARVMTLAKDKTEYKNFQDCLVLSRESTFFRQGQKYFVTWDTTLIPSQSRGSIKDRLFQLAKGSQTQKPTSVRRKYSPESRKILKDARSFQRTGLQTQKPMSLRGKSSRESQKTPKDAREEMVEHFVNFVNHDKLRARAAEMYLKFTLMKGPSCKECRQLEDVLSGRIDLNMKSKEVEKTIAKLEQSCESPTTGDDKEGAAAASSRAREAIRALHQLGKNAREYITKGRMNIRVDEDDESEMSPSDQPESDRPGVAEQHSASHDRAVLERPTAAATNRLSEDRPEPATRRPAPPRPHFT